MNDNNKEYTFHYYHDKNRSLLKSRILYKSKVFEIDQLKELFEIRLECDLAIEKKKRKSTL